MRSVGIDPLTTDAILVSHCHPDHYLDAEILIEAMTEGGTRKQGILLASQSVIEGNGDFGPAISKYHLAKPKVVKIMHPFNKVSIKPFEISATPSAHSDTSSVGFRIQTTNGMLSYVSDTQLVEQVIKAHKNCRVLIASVTRPLGQRIPHHLSTEDAGYLIENVETPVDRDLTGPEPYFSLVGDTLYPVSVVRNHASTPRPVFIECMINDIATGFTVPEMRVVQEDRIRGLRPEAVAGISDTELPTFLRRTVAAR